MAAIHTEVKDDLAVRREANAAATLNWSGGINDP